MTGVTTLEFPLAVMPLSKLREQGRLVSYEEARGPRSGTRFLVSQPALERAHTPLHSAVFGCIRLYLYHTMLECAHETAFPP